MGVATVLSTMNGTPWRWAASATASMSTTLPAGLPMLSQKTAWVWSSIRASMASALSSAAKRASTPSPGRTAAK